MRMEARKEEKMKEWKKEDGKASKTEGRKR